MSAAKRAHRPHIVLQCGALKEWRAEIDSSNMENTPGAQALGLISKGLARIAP